MQIGYRCDIGRVRELNEDSVLCLEFDMESSSGRQSMGLFIVADGMGGHNAGEVASELCIRTFTEHFLGFALGTEPGHSQRLSAGLKLPSALTSAVDTANRCLFQKAKRDRGCRGMGTTITAALIAGHELYIAHIGDSRCYIVNAAEVLQVTRDHSYVQEMVDAGLLTPEQARVHPQKNIITRVLGHYPRVAADSHHLNLYQGDSVLLCSDGLWGVVPDLQIAEIVRTAPTPQKACDDLVDIANRLGGPDNISVIAVTPEHLPSLEDVLSPATRLREETG